MFRNFLRILSLVLVVSLLWNMLPLSVLGEEFRAAQSENNESTSTEADATLETQEPEEITILGELTDRRTENIKEYLLSNGNTIAAVYGNSVHYQEDGQWKEIDNTLIAKNGTYVNTAGLLRVSFPQNLNGNNYITVTKDGHTLSFGMAGQLRDSNELVAYGAVSRALTQPEVKISVSAAKTALAQLHTVDFTEAKAAAKYPELVQEKLSSRLSYSNVYDNTNITYDLDSNRVKESVILSRYDATLRGYRYTLQTGDMVPVLAEDGHIDFYDARGEEIILTMPSPFLVDADMTYNWDIEVSLTGSNGTYTLTYLLPQSWLAAEDRAWPVVLDPEVQAGSSATTIADQTVFSYGSEDYRWEYLLCGRDASDIDEVISRFYLKFTDLPTLTSADVVVDAEVALYCIENDLSPFYVGVHSVNGPWSSSGITWSNKPGYNTKAADFVLLGNRGTYRWNITDIVREWYQINENPNNNFGMMFEASVAEESPYASNEYALFYSSDSSINKPQLTIEYRNTTGLEDYWDYTSASAGRAGTAYVNNGAGNLVFVRNLMAFGGNRMPVSIDLVYNASDKDSNSYGVGNGWRTNYHQRVYPFGSDYYVWEDADGTRHYFRCNATKDAYYDEDNLNLVITEDYTEDKIIMTDLAGNTSTFEMTGRLTKIQNNQETPSSIDIEYVGDTNRISQITDGVGRKYVFTYTNNLLTRISYKATGTSEHHYVNLIHTNGNLTKIIDADKDINGNNYSCTYTYSNKLLITASDPHGIGLTFDYCNTAANGANRIFRITEHQKTVANGVDSYEYGNYIEFTYSNKWTTLTDAQGNVQHMLFNTHGNTINIQDDKGVAAVAEYAAGQKHQLTLSSDLRSPSVNWLANGSFEGSGGYSVSGALDYGLTNSADTGGKALYAMMPNNAAGLITFSSISIAPGESCTVSAYIKIGAGEATLQLYSGGRIYAESVKLTSTHYHQWIRLSASYTNNTAAATTMTPQIHLARFTGITVDCVQLEKTSAPSPLNLLQNSDFAVAKTNTNYGWTESGLRAGDGRANITSSVAPAMDGNVIRLTGAATLQKRVNQQVNISGAEGDVLTLAGWGKGYVPKNGATYYGQRQFGIELTFYNASGKIYTEEDEKNPATFLFSPNTEGWQYVAGQAVAPADYTYVVVTLLLDYNVNTVYFDGIQLCREGLGDEYTYNENGDVETVTNSKGQTTSFFYTNRDLSLVIYDDGNSLSYSYDTYKNVLAEKNLYVEDGEIIQYTKSYLYDTYGNVSATFATDRGIAYLTYTDNGNYLQTYQDEKGNLTTYDYDQNTGVLESVVYPQNDPAEDLPSRTVTYRYDNLFRPTLVSQGSGSNARSIEYCYEGDYLTGLTTGSTNYSFTYGSFGASHQVSAGPNILATYGYTGRNLTSLLYGNGAEVTYVYDSEGRVIEEHYPDGEEGIVVKYGYDGVGRLVSVTDGFTNRATNYSYDAEGNLLCAETRQGNTTVQSIRYQYDEHDQLVGKTTALGTSVTSAEAYAYNAQHLPEQMTVGNLRQIATYNAAGLLTELETGTPNSADSIATIVKTDEYAYDSSNNFLTQHEIFISGNTNSGNPDYSYYYQYDSKGNIGQILQAGSSGVGYITYTYDAANQLIREANPFAGYTWIMTYDDAGNMLSRTKYEYAASYENAAGFQISEQTFTYGSEGWGDVLTSINGVGVQSDEIGNITNDGTWTYTWKNGRQLATMSKSGTTWNFFYDASGMRTQRSNGSTTYTYTYDGGKLTQMKMGSSTMRFTYGINGHPVSLNYDGTVYYYVTNAQGDVVAILNSSGQEVVSYTYDAWGNMVKKSGSKANDLGTYNPLRYRGYVYDRETGLYYLQSRYYNPTIGRFISADALLATDQGPLGYNLFAYCLNNPVNMTDYTGNLPEWANTCVKIFSVVAIAVATVAVITGTGGTGAVLLLGAACAGATGGYFNEQAGGEFASGYVGGVVSGLTQGFAGLAGPLGVVIGGSIGSGLGTLIAGGLDNYWGLDDMQKSTATIFSSALKSSAVAFGTSMLTGYIDIAVRMGLPTQANGLMPGLTNTFGKMINAFFGALDDAMTYIIIMGEG